MKAPALEKGLDILELLVTEGEEMTLSQIAARNGRRVSEIQRMVHVLVRRGYLDRSETNTYRPGLKLYRLGRFRHPFRHLQDIAEPLMAGLAKQCGHSIHLSVEDRGSMLILSEILGSGVAALALKVGSTHSMEETLSGRILSLNHPGKARASDRQKLRQRGYLQAPSSLYSGVMDLGVPIRDKAGNSIQAVIACSWLKHRNEGADVELLVHLMMETADQIAGKL
jgi:DNA-binding IclR family transcriptional regulator